MDTATNWNKSSYPDAKRPDMLGEGIEYQDFVCAELAKRHIVLQNLTSKKYQYEIGENLQGFEIKLDRRCTDTERLSIEIAEKSAAANRDYIPSGIYRNDNAWLYLQGNYEILFVFARNFLVNLHKSGRYEVAEMPTIRKFYLPFSDAKKYAALYLNFANQHK